MRARRRERWAGRRVCVTGIGVSGTAAARVLSRLGAVVTVVDTGDGDAQRDRAVGLAGDGVAVRLGAAVVLPDDTELVVTSPGWAPQAPLLAAAAGRGLPVYGEVELAWRLRGPDPAPWLAITGTNGKTTAVRMLAAILEAAGVRATAAGNVGAPIVDAVLADPPYQALAVELSSFQLHWSESLRPLAATVLNVAPDHLDWHGSYEAYRDAKARIWGKGTTVVYNADDTESAGLAAGRRGAISFTLGPPGPGQLGVDGGALVDGAFAGGAGAAELAAVADVSPPAPHNVANALAAAALARAYGVPAAAVRDGLRAFRPDAHRLTLVAEGAGVRFVDDSKATNPHAVAAALSAYDHVVWIAGGLLKGARVDDVVAAHHRRMRAAVLLGRDRAVIRDALVRHAPNVPVVEVSSTDTGVMDAVVAEAARFARPGDTVLLSPAGASWDMFPNYPARGDAFAAAARRWVGTR
ncbi:MAG: UDP-N-acetylmuramoyl-L-alanine--D-glutamate ligase [Streptosporangiales bacterium]|nr:UDP-N-acetylmuramoyl-L-alanine--D-glutamate ligase [Streptosporangiales bacterium]